MEGTKLLVYDKILLSDLKEQYYHALGAVEDFAHEGTALYLIEQALIRFAINMMPDTETREMTQRLAETNRDQVVHLILRLES